MTVQRPLILFLAFCGGAALFGLPLMLAARAFSGGTPGAPVAEHPRSSLVAAGPSARSGEMIGELRFTAFDLGFEPSRLEVVEPGRYDVTFTNDGAVLHNISFADGTVIEAEAGQSATGEVIVPAEGLPYVCSIPGHADGGMRGAVTVAGGFAEVPHSGAGHDPGAAASIAPDPNAPEYTLHDAVAPPVAEGTVHEVELTVSEREMTVAPGVVQSVWTFDDIVPGPVLRVTVGDTVRVTLKNPDTNQLPHSID